MMKHFLRNALFGSSIGILAAAAFWLWFAPQGIDSPAPRLLFETPEFTLTRSTGETLSKGDLRDKVWLVNFIFTRCPGPCPYLTGKMRSIQDTLTEAGIAADRVKLVSITVDPAYDSPEVLSEYAEKWSADPHRWYFLTGPERETMRLIREGFKVAAAHEEGPGSASDDPPPIVHTTSFLLVDTAGWVREIFHMEDPDLVEIIAAAALNLLQAE